MIVLLNIPNHEFDNDVKDKFQDYFSRVKADLRDYPSHDKLCGNYEMETTDMFLASFKRLQVLPDNATNGDVIKAMFPNIETLRQGRIYPPPTTDNDIPIDGLIALDGEIKCSIQADLDWWNSPYERGNENGENI